MIIAKLSRNSIEAHPGFKYPSISFITLVDGSTSLDFNELIFYNNVSIILDSKNNEFCKLLENDNVKSTGIIYQTYNFLSIINNPYTITTYFHYRSLYYLLLDISDTYNLNCKLNDKGLILYDKCKKAN